MQSQIDNLLQKGYAKKLSRDEGLYQSNRVWYLPIFITLKPNKVRLVWDATAKSKGVSLNDFVLSGLDLLNPLAEALLGFRVGRIVVCGDIAEMFHRINVRESDMHAQRFLWWDKDDALTFGVNCAPCIAHYVHDTNANKFKSQFPL